MRPRRRCLVRNAPAPSYGFVVALKFVALERDNRSGKSPSAIGIDRPPTASQPTGSFIGRSRRAPASFSPGATAGLNSIESLMLNRTSWSGLVVCRRALASSAWAVSIQRSLSRFARSASGSTPTKCDALLRSTYWFAETTGTRSRMRP